MTTLSTDCAYCSAAQRWRRWPSRRWPHVAERPDAIGLALPGMPVDAAGMGGDIVDWESQPVMLIGDDGELTEFDY